MGLRFDVETDAPATSAAAVSPHDTNELATYARMLYIGTAGTLKVTTVDDVTVTFGAVTAGTILPLRVKIVFNIGTSASNIVALH